MAPEFYGLLGLCAVFVLIVLRVPVGTALGVVGLGGYALLDGWEQAGNTIGETASYLAGEDAYGLTVVPLFILMGVVATRSGMSGDLYRAANALFSGFRGALAMGTVGACAGFGAICGSSLATAATMSRVAIPEMRKFGYSEALATGTVASGGTLGILIPPSVILIFYAIIAEGSVPALFAAALIPGLLLAFFHVIVISVVARLRPADVPDVPGMSLSERLLPLLGLWKIILLFGVAVGGIYAAIFSPTAAAAISAVVAIIIAGLTRSMGLAGLRDSLIETVGTTAMLFYIVLGAFMFKEFIVLTQLPSAVIDWVGASDINPYLLIVVILAVYLLLGCFLDSLSMILITVPVFLGVVETVGQQNGLGFDKTWFGIFVVIVAEVGLITPPVGMNIFVIRAQMPDIPLGAVYKGIVPFLFAHLALLVLLAAWPDIANWLPTIFFPKGT